MTRYLIGIDNGSQSSKVTIFDEHGAVVSTGRCALRPSDMPAPGVVEHPDDDLWTSIGAAAREALAGFDGDPRDIVGVGLCTIRFCRAMLRADGSLAQPVLSWMDARVAQPFRAERDDVAWVTTSSGYITHRLTGEFRDTAANYQGMWPIDTGTWRWLADDDDLAEFGIARSQLFDLVDPGDVLGTITAEAARHTGLPEGLPVVATANDKAVEALGCGLAGADTVLVSLGTYIAGMTVGTHDARDASAFWSNFASIPGRYLYESGGIRRGMWTISWFRDLLGEAESEAARASGSSLEDVLGAEAALVPAGSDGLVAVLDWLAPAEAPYRRGSLLGFDGRHGRAHVYRALLEGIALTMHERTTALSGELGVAFERVVLSGGGSQSNLMMQIVADVFGVPAARNAVSDGAGLGAAICAAVGLGVHPGFEEAQVAMVAERDVFRPDAARHAFYGRLQTVYRDVTGHTDEVYRRLAAVPGVAGV
ncbi:FGGY-family carbohydrate kinase [Frigoribacterium sp. 2-23]|uniref:FGGY-family carbohydrate kinase n=1 Tax=Frigoribacterium sp. 2-23 TaxID=3415006 RepID=UPI003C6F242A